MRDRYPNHPLKKYPVIGACGLDCGLCPRYHSGGEKPCPGCCGQGFWERSSGCAFITCCVKQRGLEVCAKCNEFEFCPRIIKHLKQAKSRDSLLSYQPVAGNFEFVQKQGTAAWAKREQEKVDFLKKLIENYNDGRSKGFYCLSVQLLPLEGLKKALAEAEKKMPAEATLKDRAKVVRDGFSRLASEMKVELRLRTKSENPTR